MLIINQYFHHVESKGGISLKKIQSRCLNILRLLRARARFRVYIHTRDTGRWYYRVYNNDEVLCIINVKLRVAIRERISGIALYAASSARKTPSSGFSSKREIYGPVARPSGKKKRFITYQPLFLSGVIRTGGKPRYFLFIFFFRATASNDFHFYALCAFKESTPADTFDECRPKINGRKKITTLTSKA